ncbi:unnamed protein product [Dovyalis caffra]|uniref:Uncharacterized protein n=1 Tax=Dovyalis caffra TaxID=77055 RepID=A0AAV1RB40_9ROSI|nr:unnamed protein product [Dovyalis caffra]
MNRIPIPHNFQQLKAICQLLASYTQLGRRDFHSRNSIFQLFNCHSSLSNLLLAIPKD